MTCCAILMVKDEADVIEACLRHLAGQVDQIICADNMSSDGTRERLAALIMEQADRVLELRDGRVVDEHAGHTA